MGTEPDRIVRENQARLYHTWALMKGKEKRSKRGSPTCLCGEWESDRNNLHLDKSLEGSWIAPIVSGP